MQRKYVIGLSVFAAVILIMILIGHGSSNPPVGAVCTVQFRRDALGASGLPISPTNEAAVSMTGTLKAVHPKWLVLAGPGETWIARDTVLLIRILRK
ncbi:MAG: hypothetical protein ACYC1M_18955 [Armatimonadota bacterium]